MGRFLSQRAVAMGNRIDPALSGGTECKPAVVSAFTKE